MKSKMEKICGPIIKGQQNKPKPENKLHIEAEPVLFEYARLKEDLCYIHYSDEISGPYSYEELIDMGRLNEICFTLRTGTKFKLEHGFWTDTNKSGLSLPANEYTKYMTPIGYDEYVGYGFKHHYKDGYAYY